MTKYVVIRLNEYVWPIYFGVYDTAEEAELNVRAQIAIEGRTITSESPEYTDEGAAGPQIFQKQFCTAGNESANSWLIQEA
jgi:hypothetical protein